MARRLPRGRTMGYGCPPPLAGGGVAPSNADTRVITALLATATGGGVGAERWGAALYTHLHFCPPVRNVMKRMKAVRMDINQGAGWSTYELIFS